MRTFEGLAALLVVSFLGVGASGCRPSKPPPPPDAVAWLGDEPVRAAEVAFHLRPAPPRVGPELPADPREVALEQAIRVRLFAREAIRRGLQAPSGPPALVQSALVQELIAMELERHDVRPDAITDEEARRFFEEHQVRLSRPKAIDLSAIAVRDADLAETLLQRAATVSDEAFAALVAQHSVHEASKAQGGKLATVDEDGHGVEEDVARVALQMRRAGQVGGPVQPSDGLYYVLRASKVELTPPVWSEKMAIRIKNLMTLERREQRLAELARELRSRIEVKPERPALARLEVPGWKQYAEAH